MHAHKGCFFHTPHNHVLDSRLVLLAQDPLGASTECCPQAYRMVTNSSLHFGNRFCMRGDAVPSTCSGHGICNHRGLCQCQTYPEQVCVRATSRCLPNRPTVFAFSRVQELDNGVHADLHVKMTWMRAQYTGDKCQCKWFGTEQCGQGWVFIRHSSAFYLFQTLNTLFLVIFTVEMAAKMFAFGVYFPTGVVDDQVHSLRASPPQQLLGTSYSHAAREPFACCQRAMHVCCRDCYECMNARVDA